MTQKSLLYKVSPPRESTLFSPSEFWRTENYQLSSHTYTPGFIKDKLLFAGRFQDISIHLLPNIRRIEIRNNKESTPFYKELDLPPQNYTSHLFAHKKDQAIIESFEPTVHQFKDSKFEEILTCPKKLFQSIR